LDISENYLYRLNYSVNQTNLLLQNEMVLPETDFESSRKKLWDNQINAWLDSLEHYKKIWRSQEIREKYEVLWLNLKKLQKTQEEIVDLLKQEQSASYFEADESPEQVLFKKEINSKAIFKNNWQDLIHSLDKHFNELKTLQSNYFENQKRRNNYSLNQFWVLAFIWLFIFIAGIIVVAYSLANRIQQRINLLRYQVRTFSQGNIPEFMPVFRDETGEIVEDLHSLARNLQQLKDFAYKVKEGNFSEKIDIFHQEGELGVALLEMHDGLETIATRDYQRNWTNEGIALFGNLLREYGDAQMLYDDLISNLVKYLMSNQGGIFVLNDSQKLDPVLELMSVYAYDRKRFVEKSIRPGQGLIGQAWKEKDTIYLENVSENYVQISSGLGGGKPRSLLIVPMINNESTVLGVIELASFKVFQPYEIDFVKRVGEMIVSAISSLKSNENTQILLSESRQASEQLRLQEEATRKQVHVLQQTQDELLKKQQLLVWQDEAIHNSMALIEIDLSGIVIDINDIALQLLGYSSEEVKGESYAKLIGEREFNSAEYQHFWQNLLEGINQTQELKYLTKNGNELWFNASYTAVKDQQGRIYKIINLALEITEFKKSNQHLKEKIETIYQALPIIEFNIHGVITDANDLFLRLAEYKLDELKGKPHRILISRFEQSDPGYQDFWFKLAEGESKVGVFHHLSQFGKEFWLKGAYQPLKDAHGSVYKIVLWAQDITVERQQASLNTTHRFEIPSVKL
jgi:PAS domain S-box-containing protein